jgi:chitinase
MQLLKSSTFYPASQKRLYLLIMLLLSSISTAAFANMTFRPYKDFTMNTHWDNGQNNMQPEDLGVVATQSGVKNFTLAFVVAPDGQTCKPTWGGMNDYAVANQWGLASIENLRKHGGNVKISFGGASGTDLSVACRNTNQLKQIYSDVLNTYHVTRLDFDIEGGLLLDDQATTRMMKAISELQQQNPKLEITFTLPVLPSGLTIDGIRALEKALKEKIKITHVNIMAMDYGDFAAPRVDQMGDNAIIAAMATMQQLAQLQPSQSSADIAQQVIITSMIGINDTWHYNVTPAQPERFTLADAQKVNHFAQVSGMTEIAMWSITRDHPCNNQWADPTCSGAVVFNGTTSKMQTEDYAFSKVFLSGSR